MEFVYRVAHGPKIFGLVKKEANINCTNIFVVAGINCKNIFVVAGINCKNIFVVAGINCKKIFMVAGIYCKNISHTKIIFTNIIILHKFTKFIFRMSTMN